MPDQINSNEPAVVQVRYKGDQGYKVNMTQAAITVGGFAILFGAVAKTGFKMGWPATSAVALLGAGIGLFVDSKVQKKWYSA